MKDLLKVTCVIALLAMLALCGVAQAELLPDGDFEDGMDAWYAMGSAGGGSPSWHAPAEMMPTWENDGGGSDGGAWVALSTQEGANEGDAWGVSYIHLSDIPVSGGEELTFSGMAKSSVATGVQIRVFFFDDAGTMIPYTGENGVGDGGLYSNWNGSLIGWSDSIGGIGAEWTPFTTSFTADNNPDIAKMQVWYLCNGIDQDLGLDQLYLGSTNDFDPPTPNPMTWATVPTATSEYTIAMTATTASDVSGVEYYFTCTAGGGNDSGWQNNPTYEDTGLTPETSYTYTVTARDKSSNQNTTAASSGASATTLQTGQAPQTIIGVNGDTLTLDWNDEFDIDGFLDLTYWSQVPRQSSDWNDKMDDSREDLVDIQNGICTLHGIYEGNDYLTGGIWTRGKLTYLSGQIQIRARMDSAQGAWPALWTNGGSYSGPDYAEIDILEHLNWDGFFYQTVHNDYTLRGPTPNDPPRYTTVQVDVGEYHIYSVEWDADAVTLMVDGVTTFVYPRVPEKGPTQYPFDSTPMCIILSMQIEGGWVGSGDPAQYPIQMDIDYVRVYSFAPAETDPPTPDPMTWATAPNATGPTSISMTATTATDPSGVEYYFTCTAGGGNDSGWQDSATYEDTGLTPETSYTYTVTARDKSANQNTTAASSGASATTLQASQTSVVMWQGDKKAAVSITFDDGHDSQFDTAFPLLQQRGLKGTFFIISNHNTDRLGPLVQDGQEIGSHTVSHPYLATLTGQNLEDEIGNSQWDLQGITGQDVLTLAYPYGDYNQDVINITDDYYIAGRKAFPHRLNSSSPAAFYELDIIGPPANNGTVNADPIVYLNNYVDLAIAENKWAIEMLHTIDYPGGWENVSSEELGAHLDYLVENEPNVWVAPMGTVCEYIYERDAAVITTLESNSNFIRLDLSCELDSRFNTPLTLLAECPAGWESGQVHVQQGQMEQMAEIVFKNGSYYMMYNVLPDAEPIELLRSQPTLDTDLAGFAVMAQYWLQTGCGLCGGADLSGDSDVDIDDLIIFGSNWLEP